MVKIKASALCACLAILSGCAGRALLTVKPEKLVIPGIVPGKAVSLALNDSSLLGVFSDTSTTALCQVLIPLGEHLPRSAPAVSVIDRIDSSPPLATGFGAHVLLVRDRTARVLYADRESEAKTLLKLVSRPLAGTQWVLEVLEPAGFPVALLPKAAAGVSAYWAAGGLMEKGDAPAASTIIAPFSASATGSITGPDAFTAYDDATRTLFLVRDGSDGLSTTSIVDGTRVQSSTVGADGRVAILTWNEARRRLLLLEQEPATGKRSTTTVTLCEGTTSVQILPVGSGRLFIFLFDESVRRAGATVHQLSLIAPSYKLGATGGRYRKAVLYSGDGRVDGFSAVQTSDALYILVAGESLAVLRINLN